MKDRKPTKIKRVEVIVEIDSAYAALVPGLTADCQIIIDKLDDVVTLPKECVFDKDSVKIVYVRENDSYIPYPVAIKKQSDDFVALNSELKGGEICALREPNPARVKWPKYLKTPAARTKSDSLEAPPSDSLTSNQKRVPVYKADMKIISKKK